MTYRIDRSRRLLLGRLALAVAVVPIAVAPLRRAQAADTPLLTADDPTAKALKYVSDARKSPAAVPGSSCASCALYQGTAGAAQGPCLLFPGRAVKATGWCSSWAKKA